MSWAKEMSKAGKKLKKCNCEFCEFVHGIKKEMKK